MRLKRPKPFDKEQQYNIGERVTYQGKTLICVKHKPTPKWLIEKFRDMYLFLGKSPTQCGMCDVKRADCQGIPDSPCFSWNREDRKNINFRILRINKNECK